MIADCHVHMVLDGVQWKEAIARHRERPDDGWIRKTLEICREQNITYIRDGGDRWGVGKRARELAPEYGITYKTPLAPLCREGHYGGFLGSKYKTMEEYTALVRKAREDGADFIKIMISGIMDFDHFGVLTEPGYEPELIRELIRIAHEEGMAVMAHANGARVVEAAAEGGVDSVEHGAYLDQAALEAMLEHRTVWVPTLSAIGNLLGRGRFDDGAVAEILASSMENVRAFAQAGGLVAPGSDAGAWAVPHGCMTEYRHLEKALGQQAPDILDRGTEAIVRRF